MRSRLKSVVAAVLSTHVLCACAAHLAAQQSATSNVATPKLALQGGPHGRKERMLTSDDGLAVISAALDTQRRFGSEHDCSHLVHAIYEKAGFSYVYASSDDLYDGVEGFRRVYHPQTGDLIVWHGHVGIVVRPSRHVFFSFLSVGPGTDNYRSDYWISRGEPRFYRYIKNDPCPGCTLMNAGLPRNRVPQQAP